MDEVEKQKREVTERLTRLGYSQESIDIMVRRICKEVKQNNEREDKHNFNRSKFLSSYGVIVIYIFLREVNHEL